MQEKSAQQEQFEKSAQISRKEVYRGSGVAVRCDTLLREDGSTKTWDVVVRPDAAVIVPVTDKGEILFVKQWRRSVGRRLIELPAGVFDEGEEGAACAQRELREETGYLAKKMVALGGFYSTPGFCTEFLHLFVATGLIADPLEADEDEAIDVLILSLSQAQEWIQSGEICDAKTIAGILRYAKWSST